jgi:hypothetical protein
MIIGNHQRTWLRRAAAGAAACLLSIAVASPALAQDAAKPADKPADATPPAPDPDKVTLNFFKGTEVGGLVDGYYQWYSTKQNGLYRAFDQSHNDFQVSMAEVWLAKSAASDSPVGYKIRMNFGQASGVYTPPTDVDYKYIEEAYGSFFIPGTKGLTVDFGKFVTNAGAEVVEAKDNWNYSRSLLFQLTIPVYHAGVRMNYSSDKVSAMVGVVNGWNNVVDTNTGKTFMASITLKPNAAFSFVENYIGGPETAGTNNNVRNLSDTVLTYTASPELSLMANLDFVGEGGQNSKGIAGYLKYQANKVVAVVPRYEYLSDGGAAFGSGIKQKLQDFTLTLELKGADNFMWRLEYRGDYSDQNVFKTDTGAFKSNQQSFTMGFLYSFSSKS